MANALLGDEIAPLVVATVRGSLLGAIAAGSAFFLSLGIDGEIAKAAIMAGGAFFTVLGGRAGVEGVVDQMRKPTVPTQIEIVEPEYTPDPSPDP